MMLKLAHFPVALYLCYPLANAEAATYKCTDGRRITYANVPCEDMNLKSAGPVKSLVTVVPTAPTAAGLNKEGNPVEPTASRDKTGENKIPGDTTIKQTSPLAEKKRGDASAKQ